MNDSSVGRQNLTVLGCANQVATAIIMKVAGNDTAATFRGEAITDTFVADAVAARMQAALAPTVGNL